jgi:hypothetical protein
LKIPGKKARPETEDNKNPYHGPLPAITKKRGARAIQARSGTSTGGKAQKSNTPLMTATGKAVNALKETTQGLFQ